MKTTREEYIRDLKAIEQALIDFMMKHGRIPTQDLDALYAIESTMDDEVMTFEHGTTRWEILGALAAADWSPSSNADYHYMRTVEEEVQWAILENGIGYWSE